MLNRHHASFNQAPSSATESDPFPVKADIYLRALVSSPRVLHRKTSKTVSRQ
jgi:hypothetical protein